MTTNKQSEGQQLDSSHGYFGRPSRDTSELLPEKKSLENAQGFEKSSERKFKHLVINDGNDLPQHVTILEGDASSRLDSNMLPKSGMLDHLRHGTKRKKQADPIHGNVYQLKLLMLFLYRAVANKYSFRLGTEIEEAKKFDDLVFEYTNTTGGKEYRLLQAKHRLDESKKITPDSLLTDSDGDYSLIKYFFSYRDVLKERLFKGGFIKDVIICTNIDFQLGQQINVKLMNDVDNILDVKSCSGKIPMRYKISEDVIPRLKEKLQEFNLTILVRRLVDCCLNGKVIKDHDKNDVFKDYHVVLAEEVIDVKNKKFHDKFIEGRDILDETKMFRNMFTEELKRKSDGISLMHITLNLSKKFGKGECRRWPKDVISNAEIKDFLNRLVFAVNQPNEEELGQIIKREIGEGFDLIKAENLYNNLFMKMLDLLQGKEDDRFLSYEEGIEFFVRARREVPIHFNVRDSVRSFTGRTEQLKEVHAALQNGGETVISQIASIAGLGGVGKSELARKYVSKYRNCYDNRIVWINAENYESLSECFRRLSQDTLRISTKNINGTEKSIKSVVEDVYGFFAEGKSLFIFDNAEKLRAQKFGDDGIDPFLPAFLINKPYVLITSRNQKWGDVSVLRLDIFTKEESTELIKKALNIDDGVQESNVNELAETLQHFPLALQQAVAYIKERNEVLNNVGYTFDIRDYLVRYREETRKLLDYEFPTDSNDLYTKTTFTTWKITTDKIEENRDYGSLALGILNILAYCAPDKCSVDIFVGDKEQLCDAIQLLKNYSMVSFDGEKMTLSVHRLVQQVTRLHLKRRCLEEDVLMRAVLLLATTYINSRNVNDAVSIWHYVGEYQELAKKSCALPERIVDALMLEIRYEEARKFGLEALDLLSRLVGENDPATLDLQYKVGLLLGVASRHSEALLILEPLLEKDLEFSDREKIRHTRITKARQLCELSRYEEAKLIYQHIFGTELVSETNDEAMLTAWHDYALLLADTDECHESLKILKEVLNKRTAISDVKSDSVLNTKSSIAYILMRQCKYVEALNSFRELFSWRKATLGINHPDTVRMRDRMANALQKLGKHDEAFVIYEECVDKFKRILGEAHADTLATQANLASLFEIRKEYQKALDMYRYVYEKQSESLGRKQCDTLQVSYNIASILCAQKKCDEALKYVREASEGFNEILGLDHPTSVQVREDIERLLTNANRLLTAVKRNDFKAVDFLLLYGVCINFSDITGCTALHYAANKANITILNALIKNGADAAQVNNNGETPLHFAVSKGRKEIVEVLLSSNKLNGFINAETISERNTALYVAAKNGSKEIVISLLKHGAIYNVKYEDVGLLKLANELFEDAKMGNIKIIDKLRAVKRDEFAALTNARNNQGNTLLQVSIVNKRKDVATKLLEMLKNTTNPS